MASLYTLAWMTQTFLLWFLLSSGARAQSLLPVTAKGSKFFDSEGKQFFIRGVAYALGADVNESLDVLSDPGQCMLDAELMQRLLVNTIRVYTVNSTLNHTECMNIFMDHGIYVIVDLTTPTKTIYSDNPEWTLELFEAYTKILSDFASFENLLAVVVGNEVIKDESHLEAAPYIKAAARDVKAYRDAQKMRRIPVGYTTADLNSLFGPLKDYLACGGDNSSTIDFFGYNDYSWCGPSSFEMSSYKSTYQESLDSPLPQFFAETGCKKVGNRTFDDQESVLGPDMNHKWSGSIIYEWRQNINEYGIVSYPNASESAFGYTGTPTPITPDFYSLQSHWDTLTPTGVSAPKYTPTETTPACPTYDTDDFWTIRGNDPLPTIKNLVIPTKILSNSNKNSAAAETSFPAVSTSNGKPVVATANPGSSSSSSLSTGAKAAIGAVVPLVAIGIAAATFWIWRRKRQLKGAHNPGYSQAQPRKEENHWGRRELGGGEMSQLHAEEARNEADGRPRYQLSDGVAAISELNAGNDIEPQELPSTFSVRRNARD